MFFYLFGQVHVEVPGIDLAKQKFHNQRQQLGVDLHGQPAEIYEPSTPVAKAPAAISLAEQAYEIIGIGDRATRQARIKELGLLNRRTVEEQMRQATPNATDQQIHAAMVLTDQVADSWARQQGWSPNEATRDAYYATRIMGISGEGGEVQFLMPNENGLAQVVSAQDMARGFDARAQRAGEIISRAAGIQNEEAVIDRWINEHPRITLTMPDASDQNALRGYYQLWNAMGEWYSVQAGRAALQQITMQPPENLYKTRRHTRVHRDEFVIYPDPNGRYLISKNNAPVFDPSSTKKQLLTFGSKKEASDYIQQQETPTAVHTVRFAQPGSDPQMSMFQNPEMKYQMDLADANHRREASMRTLSELLMIELNDADFELKVNRKLNDVAVLRSDPRILQAGEIYSQAVKDLGFIEWQEKLRKAQTDFFDQVDEGNGQVDEGNGQLGLFQGAKKQIAPASQGKNNPRAMVSFSAKDGRALIQVFEQGDIFSLVHELGHVFRRDLNPADLDVVAKLGGLKDRTELMELQQRYAARFEEAQTEAEIAAIRAEPDYQRWVQAEEYFARAWERYLAEGKVPDFTHVNFETGEKTRLKTIFRRFTDWVLNVYKELKRAGGFIGGFEQQSDFTVGKQTVQIDTPQPPSITPSQSSGTQAAPLSLKVEGRRTLRAIFDDLLAGDSTGSRPLSLDGMVAARDQAIRGDGRNYKMSEAETRLIARREVILQLLAPYQNAKEARQAADDLYDFIRFEDGTITDETAIYQALQEIREDASLDPWKTRVVKTVTGTTTTAVAVNIPGMRYSLVYQVIDLGDVHTSDRWMGNQLKPNADYNQAYQPRDRGEQTAREQVESISSKLSPELLLDEYKTTDRGAPIVSTDQMVLSGNGRVLSIARAIDGYPERYQDYRVQLDSYARKYGIDPAEYADMQHPILVRVLMNASLEETMQFISDANSRASKDMTDFESANADALRIDPKSLVGLVVDEADTVEGMLHRKANLDFVRSFMYKIPETERGALFTNGMLTGKGVTRIKNALFAVVYQGEAPQRLLNLFASSQNENIRIIEAAMMKTLPIMAQLKAEMAAGRFSSDLDITNDVAIAADRVAWYRHEGYRKFETIDVYLQTDDLFNPLTPLQKDMMRLFYEIKSEKTLREMLRAYVLEAMKEPDPRQQSMLGFGEVPARTKEQLFSQAVELADAADRKPATPPEGSKVMEAFNSGEAVPLNAYVASEIQPEVRPLQKPPEYDTLVKIVEGDSLFHERQDRMEALDWLEFWMGSVPLDTLDFLNFRENYEPTGSPVQVTLESQYPQEVAALKEHSRRLNHFTPAREILSAGEPATGSDSSVYAGIPAKGIYIVKAANLFLHGADEMIGAVYVDGKMVAYLPLNSKGLGEIPDVGAKLLGVDLQDPNQVVYLNREGKIIRMDPKKPGEILNPRGNTREEAKGLSLAQDSATKIQQQIHTPEFKTWFGNWEAPETLRRLLTMKPVEINSKPLGELSNTHLLLENARKRFREFLRLTVYNKEQGIAIRFQNNAFKETAAHTDWDTYRSVRVLQELPTLLENAIEYRSEADTKHRRNVIRIHFYGINANLDGEPVLISLAIREVKENGNSFYYYDNHVILNKQNTSDALSGSQFPGDVFRGISKPRLSRWIENVNNHSKVVDANGRPLVVYHGTTEKFNVFNFDKVRTNGTSEGVGFYFTDNFGIAEGYSRDTGNVIPVYLSIKKPIDMQQRLITNSQLAEIFRRINALSEQNGADFNGAGLSNYGDIGTDGVAKIIKEAVALEAGADTDLDLISSIGNGGAIDWQSLLKIVMDVTGYDGVITHWEHTTPPSNVFVVFSSEQIKSATDNNGDFDPNNPNILYQQAGEDLQPDITTQPQPGEPQMSARDYTDMSQPMGEVPLIPDRPFTPAGQWWIRAGVGPGQESGGTAWGNHPRRKLPRAGNQDSHKIACHRRLIHF